MSIIYFSSAWSAGISGDLNLRFDANSDAIVQLLQRSRLGDEIDPSDLPDTIHAGPLEGYWANQFGGAWPDICFVSDLWLISGRFREVLANSAVGAGMINPIRLIMAHGSTYPPGDWFIWSVGNRKDTLLEAQSTNLMPSGRPRWNPGLAKDHDVKFSDAALAGSDAWYEDRLGGRTLCLSANLVAALEREGMSGEKSGLGKLVIGDVVMPRES